MDVRKVMRPDTMAGVQGVERELRHGKPENIKKQTNYPDLHIMCSDIGEADE